MNRSERLKRLLAMAANKDRWEFTIGRDGKHYWRNMSANNEEILASNRGFTRLANCKKDARKNGFKE